MNFKSAILTLCVVFAVSVAAAPTAAELEVRQNPICSDAKGDLAECYFRNPVSADIGDETPQAFCAAAMSQFLVMQCDGKQCFELSVKGNGCLVRKGAELVKCTRDTLLGCGVISNP